MAQKPKGRKTSEFIASLDPHRQVIKTYGDGAATITFSTDATQLAKVLSTLVHARNKAIKVTIEELKEETIEENNTKSSRAPTVLHKSRRVTKKDQRVF